MSSYKKYCIIKKCNYFYGTVENVRMFRFPKEKSIANEWRKAIGINNEFVGGVGGHVCIEHFTEDDVQKNGSLKKNAIPSLNLLQEDFESVQSENFKHSKPPSSPECENCIALKQSFVHETQEYKKKISELENKTELLQNKLKKLQNHSNFLQKTKADLKEKLLLMNDKKILQMFEVILKYFFSSDFLQ